MSTIKKVNSQRINNYWEPIYDPNAKAVAEWDLNDQELKTTLWKKDVSIKIENFLKIEDLKVKDITFENIDFSGNLNSEEKKYIFDKCTFIKCSFKHCLWINIKFRQCAFISTSFSLSKFENCEFRDNCKFEKIGISGNEMQFQNVFINPKDFLNAAYTNLDVAILKEKNRTPLYQLYRLKMTVSAVARMIENMKPIKKDCDMLILAKEIGRKSEINNKIFECRYTISTKKILKRIPLIIKYFFYYLEYYTISTIGYLSGWGLSISRSLMFGIIGTLTFALLYFFLFKINTTFLESFIRSIEYWLLFGYTKYPFNNIPYLQMIILSNAIMGMLWYATIIPMILNRIDRGEE